MFSVFAYPRKSEKQSLQVPRILICYAVLHSHKTAIRQGFHIKIVLSVNCLCVSFLKSLPSPLGSETGTIRRWKGEDGQINRKFRHFSAWSNIGKNVNRLLPKHFIAYTPPQQNPGVCLVCLIATVVAILSSYAKSRRKYLTKISAEDSM